MNGAPLWKPPYGRVASHRPEYGGFIEAMTPVGDLAEEVLAFEASLIGRTLPVARGHLLLTKSILIIALWARHAARRRQPFGYAEIVRS